MTLPFFNDFPLLSGYLPSLADLSTFFFLLAALFFVFESFVHKRYIKITYFEFVFVLFLISYVWLTVLWNLSKSGSVCGLSICGVERMITSGLSMTARLSLLLVLISLVRAEGMARVSVFIRIGFYLSFCYVLLELIDLCVPFYLGYPELGFHNLIEGYFHLRPIDYIPNRTRGLAFEPSFQGVFLIICLPFLVADHNCKRSSRNIKAWMVCILSTASVAAIFSAIFFYIAYKFNGRKYLIFSILIIIISIVALIGYISLIDITSLTSTLSRTGSWVGGFIGTIENFSFGVGPGMSGYWVTNYYPDFFFYSVEAWGWYLQGRDFLQAPTFASLFTFSLDYGVLFCLLIFACLYFKGILHATLRSPIGRASILSLFIASFALSSYQVWGYFLFLAITISRGWGQLDLIKVPLGKLDGNDKW